MTTCDLVDDSGPRWKAQHHIVRARSVIKPGLIVCSVVL